MTTLNVTQARANLYKLVDQLHVTHEPLHISSKSGGAILLAEEDWRAIQETLTLLSIKDMRESIIEGMETPIGECSEEIDW